MTLVGFLGGTAMHVTAVRRCCAACALAFLAAVAGCASNPVDTVWYPSASAWQRGSAEGIALLGRDDTIRRVDAAVVQRLSEVLAKLRAVSRVEAQLAVADSVLPNAFAFERRGQPHIAVSLSFLEALGHDTDALATTLGHELAHVSLGHRAARAQRARAGHAALQGVTTLLAAAGMPFGALAASVGLTGMNAAYTRDEERDADALGLTWAISAGYDPCGAYRTLRTLQQAAASAVPITLLDSHPGSQERMQQINAKAMEATQRACGAHSPT